MKHSSAIWGADHAMLDCLAVKCRLERYPDDLELLARGKLSTIDQYCRLLERTEGTEADRLGFLNARGEL